MLLQSMKYSDVSLSSKICLKLSSQDRRERSHRIRLVSFEIFIQYKTQYVSGKEGEGGKGLVNVE